MRQTIPMLISSREVLERVSMRVAIDAVDRAFAALGAGAVGAPVSVGVSVPEGSFHVKACADTGGGIFVAKVNSNFPGNHACDGLPTIQGVVAVFDTATGRLRALVDSPAVTGLRTAATTAVAVRHLSQVGARVATIIGCGALGRFHLEALAACGVERVSLFDRVAARAQGLAEWGRSSGIDCLAVADARAATLASEIVVTCTTSRAPLLGCDDVRPGTLVAAVGADNENKAEIAPELLARARIVADLASQCAKIGDLRNAAPGAARVCGELADAVAGRLARVAPDEIVLFDSTGLALEDLAICALLARSPAASPA